MRGEGEEGVNKPRVYQGVRVKTTVKELLQRHRAREANRKKLKTISQACLELQDLCASTLPSKFKQQQHEHEHKHKQQQRPNFIPSARYVDPAPPPPPPPPPPPATTINTPAELSSCGARALQLRSAPYPVPLPLPDSACSSSSSSSSIPAPCSSPESLKLCSPVDQNSYSPQDSFSSSSSSSCYDSPTRMESGFSGFSSDHYHHHNHHHHHHYPQCSLQDCYCLPHCWPGSRRPTPPRSILGTTARRTLATAVRRWRRTS
ncbi:hypothetical protein INR49_032885 [Caranx melampygus]|nr:hypothetical protein INR49_032885 [Caranx melampygus]